MKGKKHAILAVLVTVVVDIIMLLIPHANNVAYWVAFVCLTLSGLLFLLPMLFQARDYVTRVPVLIALAVNYVVQIVVLFLSNTGWWRVTMILELIVLLAVAAIALYTSFFEEHNDAANDSSSPKARTGTRRSRAASDADPVHQTAVLAHRVGRVDPAAVRQRAHDLRHGDVQGRGHLLQR